MIQNGRKWISRWPENKVFVGEIQQIKHTYLRKSLLNKFRCKISTNKTGIIRIPCAILNLTSGILLLFLY